MEEHPNENFVGEFPVYAGGKRRVVGIYRGPDGQHYAMRMTATNPFRLTPVVRAGDGFRLRDSSVVPASPAIKGHA